MIAREDSADVAVLRMAHGKVSALDAAFCEILAHELKGVAKGSARALVITGTGSTFSAGVDLFQILEAGPDYVRHFVPTMDAFFRALLTFPKPLVGAINGHAIAGGCIIAAACDYRLMADGSARIGVPELSVGVPFPALPFEIMAARITPSAFRSLVYTGRTVRPAEALELGLIDEVVEASALPSRALTVAGQLAHIPATSFALTKRAFATPILERVRVAAANNVDVVEAWVSPEVHDAIRAYLDKTVRKK